MGGLREARQGSRREVAGGRMGGQRWAPGQGALTCPGARVGGSNDPAHTLPPQQEPRILDTAAMAGLRAPSPGQAVQGKLVCSVCPVGPGEPAPQGQSPRTGSTLSQGGVDDGQTTGEGGGTRGSPLPGKHNSRATYTLGRGRCGGPPPSWDSESGGGGRGAGASRAGEMRREEGTGRIKARGGVPARPGGDMGGVSRGNGWASPNSSPLPGAGGSEAGS